MGGGWSVITKIMQIKETHKKIIIPQVDSLLTDNVRPRQLRFHLSSKTKTLFSKIFI